MTHEIDATKCPLCSQDNACLNVKCGGGQKNDCWCKDANMTFPSELTVQVPSQLRGKACICQSCAETFHTAKDAGKPQ